MKVLLPRSLSARTVGALLAVTFLPVLAWPGLINNLLAADFMPHVYCLSQQPWLVALHVVANLVIGLSYVAISLTLVYFVYKQRNLPFHWMFLAFGLFIIACGGTHFMDVWTLWNPTYWLAGGVSLITAAASLMTAVLLPPLIPKMMALPSPTALLQANRELEEAAAEHRRTEAGLRESEARYRAVIEQSSEGIFIFDATTGLVTEANPAFLALLGYTTEEILRCTIYDLIADRRETIERNLQRIIDNGGMSLGMRQYRRRDGSVVDVEVSASVISVGRNMVCAVVRDITVRKRTLEALTAQAATLREQASLLDLAHDTIIVRRLDGKITFWNRGAEEMYGWTRAEALGKVSHELLETEFPQAWVEVEESLIREGRWEGELRHRRRDGTYLVVASRWALQYDERGVPKAALEINTDITRHKRAEETLRKNEKLLRSILDTLPVAVWATDKQGNMILDNPAGQKLWAGVKYVGLEQYDEYKAWWHDTGVPVDPQDCALVHAFQRGETSAPEVLDIQCFDGTRKTVLNLAAPLRDEDGAVFGAIAIEEDITERIRIEDEIRELNTALNQHARQLEIANQELEAFSYSVSHDLRAPLRAMSGFARILIDDHTTELSPDALECAEIIDANARQMGELIDDLLVFSRLSRQPLNKQTVSPADIAYTLVDEMHREQNGRRVRIQIDEMPDCQADPALLKQVYANLIGNALKYTRHREATVIDIGCIEDERNGCAVYFVKDNGVGFDMRYAHKLFGVFQRLHSAEQYEGTGVGLALVQRIVHRHGGRVWAEAQPDQGATFYFTLEGNESDDRTHR